VRSEWRKRVTDVFAELDTKAIENLLSEVSAEMARNVDADLTIERQAGCGDYLCLRLNISGYKQTHDLRHLMRRFQEQLLGQTNLRPPHG
jgi:hypothetical protein